MWPSACLPCSLLLDLQLHLVVDRVGAVLLVLRGGRLPRNHLHLHSSRQKKLLLLLLLILQRVGSLNGCLPRLLHHVVLHSLGRAGAHLVVGDARCRPLRLLLVMLVQFLDVQTATALVHVHLSVHRTLDLDRLRPVSLLCVKLTAIHSLYVHDITALMVLASGAVRRRHDRLPGRVVAEVGLVHQLLVEGGVDRGVIILDRLLVVLHARLVHLGPVLEQLVEDALLLVVLDTHSFSLDGAALRSKRQTADQTTSSEARRSAALIANFRRLATPSVSKCI